MTSIKLHEMKSGHWGLALSAAALAFGTAAGAAGAQEATWPERPIEFVVTTGPGTGSDIISRLIAEIVQQEGLLPQPIVVINRPGSGGSVAMPYVFEKQGDAYTVLVGASDTILSTPQRNDVPYTYTTFPPIANVAADGSLIVVRADSPYETIDDLIEDARNRPEELLQGGGSYAGTDGITYELLQQATGAQWNFISFAGSGPESMLNLINGSVDFVTPNPSAMLDYARDGQVRVLLAMAPERYPDFPDAPTMEEAGLGTPVLTYRGFQGAPGMPDYAIERLEEVLEAVFQTERFQQTVLGLSMQLNWMSTEDYSAFLDEEWVRWTGWLDSVGVLLQR